MIVFADPLYLLLLAPFGILAALILRKSPTGEILFTSTLDLPKEIRTWRHRLARVLPIIHFVALALLVLALARPRLDWSTRQRTADAIAIEMVLDVSGSMGTRDPQAKTTGTSRPLTRLARAKQALSDFVRHRPDDLVGLITFGGYAVTRAPLTMDHAALRALLDTVQIPGAPGAAPALNRQTLLTALGDAVVTACARLAQATPSTRIVILLTDGSSNTGIVPPQHAIALAKRMGIHLYLIEISPPQATAENRDSLLADLATETGGQHFRAMDTNGLARALEAIDAMETTKVRYETHTRYSELYPQFILAAGILLLLATSLNMSIRRRLV